MDKEVKKHLLELVVVLPSLAAMSFVSTMTGSAFWGFAALGATGSALLLLFTWIETRGEEKPNLKMFLAGVALGFFPLIVMGLILGLVIVGVYVWIYGWILWDWILYHPLGMFFWGLGAFVLVVAFRAIMKAVSRRRNDRRRLRQHLDKLAAGLRSEKPK